MSDLNQLGTNLSAVSSVEQVDSLNSHFYGAYQYPHSARFFEKMSDSEFWYSAMCQEMGDWERTVFASARPKIWVAGCGTNQAVITALRFPEAEIIGSDLSTESLAIAERARSELGISNLTLTQESINQAKYADEFDYVLCTGVIHHNADPQSSLDRLARSLKTDGVLELMVFNSFHSITTSAMQRAVQLLTGQPSADHFQIQVETAEQLVKEMNWTELSAGPMSVNCKVASKSQVADLLAQPVWHSFTVEGLEAMSQKAGLEFVAPCLNQFDAAAGSIGWEIHFKEPALEDRYLALAQTRRWQLANLLMMEKSPMLWFYFQRKDSVRPLKSQEQIFDEFLEFHGEPANVTKTIWTRNSQGTLNKMENVAHRPSPRDPEAARILSELRPGRTVRNAFDAAGLPMNFLACNRIRLQLASAMYPILRLSRS